MADAPAAPRPARRTRTALLAAGLLLLGASRIAAVYTTGANWDELALLARADRSLETGVFQSGGRPGLAVLLLLPLAAGCDDEIEVVRRARLLWLLFTAAYVVGVGVLLAAVQPDPRRRLGDALLGVGLLAAVPAFLEWSIQVRTDQLALAGGIWGAVALLASRRRPALAGVAGALFALGYLGSPKLLYAVAAAGLVVLAHELRQGPFRLRRESARAAGVAAGYVALVLLYQALLGGLFRVPEGDAAREVVVSAERVRGGLSAFAFYRQTLGFRQYAELLPSLVPHALLGLGLLAATARRARGRTARAATPPAGSASPPGLALAWALLAAGTGVLLFHGSTFAYFWMTLGLFPALALGQARSALAARLLPDARPRRLAAAGLWALLLVPGALHAAALLADTQAVQRASLAFVHRNFARDEAGFHPESGLFCQAGAPIRTYFSHDIYRHFAGEHRAHYTEELLRSFRETPVKFIVNSFRLNQFPTPLRRFWAENYQPYHASVFVAGRRLRGERGEDRDFELVVPGRYRWVPVGQPSALQIGTTTLAPGATVELPAGAHRARFVGDVPDGLLVLALAEPPARAPLAFYKDY